MGGAERAMSALNNAHSYRANGSGRDTYIHRDPVVYTGTSQATPRAQPKNKPGIVPRPPSCVEKGSRPMGYTGHLPARREAIGQRFGQFSVPKDTKNLIPKLKLKHRFINPPGNEFHPTSRDYGAVTARELAEKKSKEGDNRGGTTDRPQLYRQFQPGKSVPLPKIDKLHSPGLACASPRNTQRTSTQDGFLGYDAARAAKPPPTGGYRGWGNNISGYRGYKPRFPVRDLNPQDVPAS